MNGLRRDAAYFVSDMSDEHEDRVRKNREEIARRIEDLRATMSDQDKAREREHAAIMTSSRQAVYARHLDFFVDRAQQLSNLALAEYIKADPEQRKIVGGRIRDVRRRLGIRTQAALAGLADVNVETISRIENGANVEMDTFAKVYAALFVSIESPSDVLIEHDRDWFVRTLDRLAGAAPSDPIADETTGEIIDVSQYRRRDIPVLGSAEATRDGLIAWNDEGIMRNQVDHWISRPGNVHDVRAYGLVVRGDSMEPRYLPGETIIVSPNAVVRSGNFACVQLVTGERYIKRVYRQEGGWNLISTNERYEPLFVADAKIAAVHKIVHNSHEA